MGGWLVICGRRQGGSFCGDFEGALVDDEASM